MAVGVVGLRDAELAVDFDALEVLAHHEVHHAGHGVRTVNGRGAAREDFDVVDERRWDRVQVGGGVQRIARHQTGAVDQHQRADGAQVAKVDSRGTGRAVRHTGRLRGEDRGQIVQQRFDADRAFEFQFLLTDRCHRARRIESLLRDARPRDDDGFSRLFLCKCRRGKSDSGHGCCAEQQRGTQAAPVESDLMHVISPSLQSNGPCRPRTCALP